MVSTLGRLTASSVLTLGLVGCLGGQKSPLGEYLAGIEDGYLTAQMDVPTDEAAPDIHLDFFRGHEALGSCRIVEGRKIVTLHIGDIREKVGSDYKARLLIAAVAEHEFKHAKESCTNMDHDGITGE